MKMTEGNQVQNRVAEVVLRLLRLALVSIAMVLAPAAWAGVEQAMLEQAEALLKDGKAEAAYQMLEPLEAVGAGDLVFDYLLATAALESGKPSKATFIYERILAVAPTYVGVRADMGRAYYALGDYGRAKIEFETVLSITNLPPDLRTQAEQYAKAAEARSQAKRTVFNGYIEAGVGRDSNIGSATAQSSLYLPASGVYNPLRPTGRKTADNYGTLGLGGEVYHQLNDQWGLFAGADYRTRNYNTYNDPNTWTIDSRAGVSYSGGAWLLRTGLASGQYHSAGVHMRDTVGVTADWRLALDSSSQLIANGSFSQGTYVPADQTSQNSNTSTLSLGWLTALGDGSTVVSITGSGGYENATGVRPDGDKRFIGPRFLMQKTFTESLGGYVSTGATHSSYLGTNTTYNNSRNETLYDLTVGLTWTIDKGILLRPTISYAKNNSNDELYSYNKIDASINLRFDY
jgi:tetratricopeptide (TPR) repeat protein